MRAKEFSSVELTRLYLDRIEASQTSLNAFISVTREQALAAAEVADRDLAASRGGALTGVQIAHKDIWIRLNHNWLRFTRILRSLTILGLHDEAMAFFRFLEKKIGNAPSMVYWRKAVGLGPNRV